MAENEGTARSPRVITYDKKPEADVAISGNTLVRLHPKDRKVTLQAYLALAEKDKSKIGDCWILARGLAERRRGPRQRWLYGISDDEMLRALRSWVEAFKDVR